MHTYVFFFNDTATTEIYTLSLHDALPIFLQNPRVDFAVFETARGGILREGLGYGKNDVAVVLNVTGDHLGLKGIDTLEQLAAVKQVVVEAVSKTGGGGLDGGRPLGAGLPTA